MNDIQNAQFFIGEAPVLDAYQLTQATSGDLRDEVFALRDQVKADGADALAKMKSRFADMQNELRQMVPALDLGPIISKMQASLSSMEKARDKALSALDDGEMAMMRRVMHLQSRLLAGEGKNAILSSETDPKTLLALAELGKQMADHDLQQAATSKARDIATNYSDKRIDELSRAIVSAQREEANYRLRWESMIDCLGWSPRHG